MTVAEPSTQEQEGEQEDVKPKVDKGEKINVVVMYNDQKLTFAVKTANKLEKLIKAADQRFGTAPGVLRYVFNGHTLQPQQTPDEVDMEDGDMVHAMVMQVGGGAY